MTKKQTSEGINLKEFEKTFIPLTERTALNESYTRYRSTLVRARHAISEALVAQMHSKATTYQELSAALGVSKTTLSRLLNGTGNPTLDTLFYVSAYLGLRLDFLFSTKDELETTAPKTQAVQARRHPAA